MNASENCKFEARGLVRPDRFFQLELRLTSSSAFIARRRDFPDDSSPENTVFIVDVRKEFYLITSELRATVLLQFQKKERDQEQCTVSGH